jgi:hypothetical protein
VDKKREAPPAAVNRGAPGAAADAVEAAPKGSTGKFGAAVAKVMSAPAGATEQQTILGLPRRMIVPIAGGVALIACLAGAVIFLMPAQGPAQSIASPVLNKLPPASQSAEAQPPHSSNADPSMLLSPSDLYYRPGNKQDSR